MDAAPGRGCYDRGASAEARAAEQRERLLEATAGAVLSATPSHATVAAIVGLAGTSRNTFYTFFRDAQAAEAMVVARVLEAFRLRVDARAATFVAPREEFVELVRAWRAAVDDERALCAAAFAISLADRRGALSRVGSHLRQHLRAVTTRARRVDALSTPVDELRLTAAAAAMEALLIWYADHPNGGRDLEELGADLLLRVFR